MVKRFKLAAVIFAVIALSGVAGTYIYGRKELTVAKTSEVRMGNTPSNLINSGIIARQGDWLYFCEGTKEKLSKVKLDKSSKTVICDDSASYINVSGDWVYYRNTSDLGRLYKIGVNGENRTLLSEDAASYIALLGDWIYFRNEADKNRIYKIRTDGKKKSRLSEDSADEMAVSGGYIYYRNESDGYKLYRINANGKERQLLTEDKARHINIIDDYIYYRNDSKEYKLYKLKIDGTDRKKISEFSVEDSLGGSSDYLYFIGAEYQPVSSRSDMIKTKVLYRINKNGSQQTKLDNISAESLSVFEDWVYYTSLEKSSSAIFKIKTDGTLWQNAAEATEITEYEELSRAINEGIEFKIINTTLKANYEKVQEIVAKVIKPGMTDVEKEAALHDYLITHTKYDEKEYDNVVNNQGTYNPLVHNENSVLINGLGVCDGYAKSMQLLLDAVGIENTLVYGFGLQDNKRVGHAWNMVKLDGLYYHLDPTWDDPVPDIQGFVSYRYFNVDDDKMKKDHEWVYSSYNRCSSTKYDFMQDMMFAVTNDKWIYYSNWAKEDYSLYKIKADGSGRLKLNDERSFYLAVDGEWIYYSNYSKGGHLYKVKTDGTSKQELNKDWSIEIKMDGEWIYYKNNSDKEKQYKINKDGTSRQVVK